MKKRPRGERAGGTPERPEQVHQVGDILGGVLERLGLAEGVARQDAVRRWGEVVGDRIAAVTEATAVSGETLFVRVASSAWMSELNVMRREILARLNAGRSEGRIERVVFTLWERPPEPAAGADRDG